MALKYRFHILYRDGAIFSQDVDDRSAAEPGKSSFFDVRLEEVARFCLLPSHLSIDDPLGPGDRSYIVDLADGHFEIDGAPFHIGEPVPAGTNLRLIFFRRHAHTFNQDREELAHEVTYHFGWQYTGADGRNRQQIVSMV